MTVLTFPSTGGVKSDKVPLVDDVDSQPRRAAPKSFNPKLLESGGLRKPNVNVRTDRRARRDCQQWLYMTIKTLLAIAAVLLVVILSMIFYNWLLCNSDCASGYDGMANSAAMASAKSQKQQPDVDDRIGGVDNDNNDDEGDDDMPCKTYHSYAAAEGDMVLPVTTSSPVASDSGLTFTLSGPADYDASQLNDMEDEYKKLEKFALNKALNRKDARDGDSDVVKVFNEDFEINRSGKEVQPIIITKSARFIHDFSVNITGIVDVEGQRCYVMPLMRNSVSPPISLYDLLFKMSSGYYSMDIKKVIGHMQIVKPALKDLSNYGLYISKDCADYSTFKLENAITAASADE